MQFEDVCILIYAFLVMVLSFSIHHFYQRIISWKWSLIFLGLCLNIKKSGLTLRCLEICHHGQSTSKYPYGDQNSQDKPCLSDFWNCMRPLHMHWLVTMGASGHRQVGDQRSLHTQLCSGQIKTPVAAHNRTRSHVAVMVFVQSCSTYPWKNL